MQVLYRTSRSGRRCRSRPAIPRRCWLAAAAESAGRPPRRLPSSRSWRVPRSPRTGSG